MRIRKLTSKEAWRLMGFSDEDYNRAKKVCAELIYIIKLEIQW